MVSDCSKNFGIIGDLLKRLNDRSATLWRNGENLSGSGLSRTTKENYSELINFKPPMSSGELERLVRESRTGRCLSFGESSFLYLPPLEKNSEFIPILSLQCDLSASLQNVSLGIEMYLYDEKKLKGLGFRFEGGELDSIHDYWHVQIVTESRATYAELPECPDWIPTTVPCIPARADSPVSLLLCMLVSFYGKGIYNKLFPDVNIDKEFTQPLKYIL